MDLELSEEQRMLGESVRRFLLDSCPLDNVRRLADEEPAGFERSWWRRCADLGWSSLLTSRTLEYTSCNGALDLAVVAEEFGRLVSPGPLLTSNLAAFAISSAGDSNLRAQLLPGILDGNLVPAWGTCALGGPWDEPGVTIEVLPGGKEVVLRGTAAPVEGASEADVLVVNARGEGGFSQVVVDADEANLEVRQLKSLDLVRRFAEARFEGVVVPVERVLGEIGDAGRTIALQLDVALVVVCAEMVGATGAMFERTIDYCFERYSFGRPLASYQALKHRIADMKMNLEASYATVTEAVRAVAEGSSNSSLLASVAKCFVGERAPRILQECVQLHGGIGVTWDHDLHLYLRRVVQDRALYGTPTEHRERILGMEGV